MIRRIYSSLFALGLGAAAPWMIYQTAVRKKYRNKIQERFGFISPHLSNSDPQAPRIWFHASSAGEVLAAKPVIEAYSKLHPDDLIMVSTVTDTGYHMSADRIGGVFGVFQLPFDLKSLLDPVFDHVRPDRLVILETELWPNLIWSAASRSIPVFLVNGRISDRSFPRYKMMRRFLKKVLECIHGFSMQTQLDAQRMIELGADPARVEIGGNVKYDQAANAVLSDEERCDARRRLHIDGEIMVLTAGSTHPGEDTVMLEVFRKLHGHFPESVLILAPRHVERAGNIIQLCMEKQFSVSVWPDFPDTASAQKNAHVVIIDSMGVLNSAYSISQIAFIGGSLQKIGGHNALEAISAGSAVIFGPHTFNFRDQTRQLLQDKAAIQIQTPEELIQQSLQLIKDPSRRQNQIEAGRRILNLNQGAVGRILTLIDTSEKSHADLEKCPASDLPVPGVAASILKPASRLFGAAVGIRNYLFDKKILPTRSVDVPVISCGNLTTGGSGKTPFVMMLAIKLREKGYKPSIISRGYKAKYGRCPVTVDPQGDSMDYGDEPLLMSRRLGLDLPVIISRDRYAGARFAVRHHQSDVCLLDDGYQHRKLNRNINILMINQHTDHEDELLLPAGRLREPPASISRADALIVSMTGSPEQHPSCTGSPDIRLGTIPVFHGRHHLTDLVIAESDRQLTPGEYRDVPAGMICAIGNPDRFAKTIQAIGIELRHRSIFPDHQPISAREWRTAAETASRRGAQYLLTTEKDAVRLRREFANGILLPLVVVRVSYLIDEAADFEQFIIDHMRYHALD